VAGRQIRWASLGRVAAIAAAVLAAIVSLPALLGGERPPPVPGDVGLVPSPSVAATEPALPAPAAATAEPPPVRSGAVEREGGRGGGQQASGHKRQHRQSRDRDQSGAEDQSQQAWAPAATYAPAPVYSPPAPGEFRFER
jgi:hypothetical protein